MSLVPDFDAEPVEDDSYSFIDNGIERIEDDLHTNQEEVTLPGGSSDDEVEITKDDLHNDKEAVSLQDNSNLAAKRMEDDFYGFKDNDIKRIVDNVHMNQEEVTLSGGSSDNEVEVTKDDLHNDKEAVPIPDNSKLEPNLILNDNVKEGEVPAPEEEVSALGLVVPLVAPEAEAPLVGVPHVEFAPPFIVFEDGGTDVAEVVIEVDDDAAEVVIELVGYEDDEAAEWDHLYNSMLPPFFLSRAEEMWTQADDMGRHADELFDQYELLLGGIFQADQILALNVNMIAHAEGLNVLSDQLRVTTTEYCSDLHLFFDDHERENCREAFELVFSDCDDLKRVAAGLRRCAVSLIERLQYYQKLQEEEAKEAAEVLVEEQVIGNADDEWWPENPCAAQPAKQQQPLEREEEVPDSWEDRFAS